MPNKTQQESEAPAKVYQIDALGEQLKSIEILIKSQNITYVSRDALALALEIRDSKINNLQDKLKSLTKLGWIVVSAVAGLSVNWLWQLVINTGRVQ